MNTYVEVADRVIQRVIRCRDGLPEVVGNSLGALLVLLAPTVKDCSSGRVFLSGCPVDGLPWPLATLFLPGMISATVRMVRALPAEISLQTIRPLAGLTFHELDAVDHSVLSGIVKSHPTTADQLYSEMLAEDNWLEDVDEDIGPDVISMRGEHDHIVPRNSAVRLAEEVGGNYCEVAGSGHTPMLEDPKQYATILERELPRPTDSLGLGEET